MFTHKATDRLEFALNIIELVRDAGLTMVPSNPTEYMLDAGCRAAGITPAQALAVFKAMIAASDAPPSDGDAIQHLI